MYTPEIPLSEIQTKYNAKVNKIQNEKKLPLHHSSQDDQYEEDEQDEEEGDEDDDQFEDEEEKPIRVNHRTRRQSESERRFCSSVDCLRVVCSIRRLSANEEVSVTFQSVVWVKTIRKVCSNNFLQFVSFMAKIR